MLRGMRKRTKPGWAARIGSAAVCALIALLAAVHQLPAHAQSTQRAAKALNEELQFKRFDKVELAEPELCPSWLALGDEAQCKRLTVIYRDVHLSGFLLTRAIPSEQLYMYHVGHEGGIAFNGLEDTDASFIQPDAASLVSRLFAQEADVLVLFMPGHGFAPTAESPEVRRIFMVLNNHSAFALLDAAGDSAASYFIAHVRGFLDRFKQPYRSVTMIGRSGGGYSTTLAAAYDKRIDCSISFFGSLPMLLRLPVEGDTRNDLGDFEQYGLLLFKKLDYIDLYALATLPKRKHVQVYNAADDCCFSGEVKGRQVAGMVRRQYPALTGFETEILPVRSAKDHYNLGEAAFEVVQAQCKPR